MRGKALATYNAGVSLGTGFAMVFGGMVITYVSTSERHVLPIIGSVAAWQYVFSSSHCQGYWWYY